MDDEDNPDFGAEADMRAEQTTPKRQMTKHGMAAKNLLDELKKYDFLTEGRKKELYSEMMDLPQLPIMNMKVLAIALTILEIIGTLTPEGFNKYSSDPRIVEPVGFPINLKVRVEILRYIDVMVGWRRDRGG